jgi:hypothetical protein
VGRSHPFVWDGKRKRGDCEEKGIVDLPFQISEGTGKVKLDNRRANYWIGIAKGKQELGNARLEGGFGSFGARAMGPIGRLAFPERGIWCMVGSSDVAGEGLGEERIRL